MSGSDNDTPEDDDRTQFAPLPGQPGAGRPLSAGDDGDATRPPGSEDEDDDAEGMEPTRFAPGLGGAAWSAAAPPPAGPPAAPPQDRTVGYTQDSSAGLPPEPPEQTVGYSQDPGTGFPPEPPTAYPAGDGGPDAGHAQDPSQGYVQSAPPTNTGTQRSQPPMTADGKLPIGTLINNNYRIEEVLKSGGMGEVYRGEEIHTGDPVAIKAILQEKADDAEAGLLFKREARTLRRLSDETIVRYYNYVPDPELQRYFLVMEFIEGVPLKDHVAHHGALTVEEAKVLLSRLAGGLATAHAEEVIHRDLSPDNVMLNGGDVRTARLIDFGIAQSNIVKEATMAGRFAGKFKYVAPEQLGHYGGEISPATDIYGLALLTAAAAIGKPLDMGSSIVEAVTSRQSIPDLSFAPEELRPILSYMLEPDPSDRPSSMQAVQALVEDPTQIPEKYLGGWVPPAPPPLNTKPPGSMSTGKTQTGTMAPGLQMPGATQTGTLNTSLGPAPIQDGDAKPDKSGSKLVLVMLLVFALVMGGAGYFAWTNGMLGGTGGLTAGGAASGGGDASTGGGETAAVGGIPAPLTQTREGFLADFDTGACTLVTRVSQGANAGVIEGYSATREPFSGLPAAYEERFGARPEVLPREITPQQCAVLDFVKALQGRGRNGVEMFLSTDQVASQKPVTAQLTVPSSQAVWLILVSPRGGIFNLTERLSAPVGNQRNLSFALTLAQGADAAPQLLLAVETDEPLAFAAIANNRDQASTVLPKILDEIRDRMGAASAAVSFLELTPVETE